MAALCEQTMNDSGLVAIRPTPGMWIPQDDSRVPEGVGEVFALCRMFGACGFAQLCDDDLDRPVPLLVRPWTRDRGLLEPRRLPRRSFSRSLCVQRLGGGRMVLFEKSRPDAVPRRADGAGGGSRTLTASRQTDFRTRYGFRRPRGAGFVVWTIPSP